MHELETQMVVFLPYEEEDDTLYHKDTQAKSRCNTCETETGETGTNDNKIVDIALLVRRGHAVFLFCSDIPCIQGCEHT